jgi:ABC-type uncharacterized transport system permease subunit
MERIMLFDGVCTLCNGAVQFVIRNDSTNQVKFASLQSESAARLLELFWGFYQASQFPITVYPAWVRLMFTFFIPVAFITTVPSQALIGKVEVSNAIIAFGIALALLAVSRWFWRFGLRSYTSASS